MSSVLPATPHPTKRIASLLHPDIGYAESTGIAEEEPADTHRNVYRMTVLGVHIEFAVGTRNITYIDPPHNIKFASIYLITPPTRTEFVQVGIYETDTAADSIPFDRPLLYSFVTADFLERYRVPVLELNNEYRKKDKKKKDKGENPPPKGTAVKGAPATAAAATAAAATAAAATAAAATAAAATAATAAATAAVPLPDKVEQSQVIQETLHDSEYAIHKTDDDGDCFFHSVLIAALGQEQANKAAIKQLRNRVATKVTNGDAQSIVIAILADKSDDRRMLAIQTELERNPDNARKQVQTFVRTKEYWADEWSIAAVEELLKVKTIILDNADGYRVKCSSSTIQNPDGYVMLDYSGNHYRLVSYRGMVYFRTFDDLPKQTKDAVVDTCLTAQQSDTGFGAITAITEYRNRRLQ